METFLGIVLVVVVAAALYLIAKKNEMISKLEAELKKVDSADAYATIKQAQADLYATQVRSEADSYAAGKKAVADKEYTAAQKEANLLTDKCDAIRKELAVLELDSMVGMVNIDPYDGLKSDEVKNQLAMLRGRQDELVKNGDAWRVINTVAKKSVLNYQKSRFYVALMQNARALLRALQ